MYLKAIKHVIKSVTIMIGLLFLLAANGLAKTYYVDKDSGNDFNPGSEKAPYKTINHAASLMQAGDTTYVKAGIYNEVVELKHSGTYEDPIVLSAYPGDRPIIDGEKINIPLWKGLIFAEEKSHIIIDGFEVKNSDQFGILFKKGSNITVRNCVVHHLDGDRHTGIQFIYVNDSIIEKNEVYQTGWNCISNESGSNVKVRYNYVHDNPAHNGINIFPKTTEFPQNHYSGNDIIGNVARGCTGGIYFRFQKDCIIANNLIINNIRKGIDIIYHPSDQHNYDANILIYNNTIVNQNGDYGLHNANARKVVVKNNIFVSNGVKEQIKILSGALEGTVFDNNLYYNGEVMTWGGKTYSSIAAFTRATGQEQNAVIGNPKFKDRAAGDYSLSSDSEAIDKGINLYLEGVTEDINRNIRPEKGTFDIGAFEYNSPVVLDPPTDFRFATTDQ